MKQFRGVLIGCGFFAVNHMHGWRDVKAARIDGICDSNSERLELVGDQFDISRRYTDARHMLETEKPDFVDIATTVSSHRELVELAAHLRIPVICQKPFAQNLEDAKAMVAACDLAGVPLMVHENFRWQSAIMKVHAAIAGNMIGRAFWGRISFRSAFDVFAAQPYLAQEQRFIVEDLGIHALDVARFLLGDVDHLSARITRVNPNIRGEDVATILLDHGQGVTSVVDCSYASKLETEAFPETLIEIEGSEGSLRLSQGYRRSITNSAGTTHGDVSPPLLPWASRPWHNSQESVVLIQQHFMDCLRVGKEPATSGHDNLKTLVLVEAVYQSAPSNEVVNIAAILA